MGKGGKTTKRKGGGALNGGVSCWGRKKPFLFSSRKGETQGQRNPAIINAFGGVESGKRVEGLGHQISHISGDVRSGGRGERKERVYLHYQQGRRTVPVKRGVQIVGIQKKKKTTAGGRKREGLLTNIKEETSSILLCSLFEEKKSTFPDQWHFLRFQHKGKKG